MQSLLKNALKTQEEKQVKKPSKILDMKEPGIEDRELEELVKAEGLWEQVAVMSPVSLSKLVERGALDTELARKISDMGRQEERPWVKLSKLRRGSG